MKKTMMWLSVFMLTSVCTLAQNWKPAGDKIKTSWAEQVTPNNVWAEYPRPIM